MNDRVWPLPNEFVDLLGGRPGWRLEPMSTPGSPSAWCFVFDGKVEFSVTANSGSILLYVMATDQEIVFEDRDAFTTWLRDHRPEALQERVASLPTWSRLRSIFKWN